MSETKLYVPEDTVKKLKNIAKKFGKLNTGSTGDDFWIGSGSGGGGYDWEQFDIGVNKKSELIVCRQSGCSCNSAEEPSADSTYPLDGSIEFTDDSYDGTGQEAVQDLVKTTEILYKVLNNKNVSPKEIIGLPNAEVRRAVVELVGYDKIVSVAELLDESDTDGKLLKIPLQEDEDIVLLHVKDPSTTREYFLRVPPKMKTARQARSWTFGFEPDEFVLTKET